MVPGRIRMQRPKACKRDTSKTQFINTAHTIISLRTLSEELAQPIIFGPLFFRKFLKQIKKRVEASMLLLEVAICAIRSYVPEASTYITLCVPYVR